MKTYYKIGDIAKLYGVKQDTIRYYEEMGIIKPERADNGYRMFSIYDMWKLNVIRDMRALGFSMRQIREYIENRTTKSTIKLLEMETAILNQRLEELNKLTNNITERLENLKDLENYPFNKVVEQVLPERACYEIYEGYAFDEEMDILIRQLQNINSDHFIIGNNRIGSHMKLSSVKEGKYRDYTGVFIIADQGDIAIPAGRYLTLRYHGDCDQNAEFLPRMLRYAREHNLKLGCDVFEMLLLDVHESADVNEHVTELQIPFTR